ARAQARLIDDMLDLSRIVRGTLRLNVRAIELCAAVQGAVDAIRPVAAEKDLAVTCTLPDSPIQVLADPERLQQIVSNLLSNSVKFTPSGGKIEVQVQQEGSHVLIRVTDTGQGIKP